MTVGVKKKLIEVALPLEAINAASAREKSIRHGHPSTLHLWWARRPLAACRAVLFASLVDDPSSDPERFPTLKAQEDERNRLFRIIEELVQWENSTNERVLDAAKAEILRSTNGNPPPVLDPFAGGGSIPLEAQRLGLTAYASDLNPVAVLINKALIEIPPKFANMPPVHPDARRGVGGTGAWKGAAGLAEDVRRYGAWMRDEAERRIGHLYPKVQLPKEHGGGEATVIAWIWARTVTCPNPACGADMPLVRSFELSTKTGKETWVEPIVDRTAKTVAYEVRSGTGTPLDGTVGRQGARCVVCSTAVPLEHVRRQGKDHGLGARLMAIVADGPRGRIYLPPSALHESVARSATPGRVPDTELPEQALGFRVQGYGMTRHQDLFTKRQLTALTAFSDLVGDAHGRALRDAATSTHQEPEAYANAIATYLAFAVDKGANLWSSITTWMNDRGAFRETFARQAIPMVWDFAESNPLSEAGGNISMFVERVADAIDWLPGRSKATAVQADAAATALAARGLVSTDPPYYDNIGYADLSDYFYIWLRRSLQSMYLNLFATLLVPKQAELVADSTRYGGRLAAREHFESGLGVVFGQIRAAADPSVPVTVFYAFKQAEAAEDEEGSSSIASTGWETMLEALISAGFSIDGTWPMRTEGPGRIRTLGSNALASSIVLVCRPRSTDAGITDRRGFLTALKVEVPAALRALQHSNVAPVDLAQSAIGPGIAVFSRYAKVVEPDGRPMTVRTALGIINSVLAEVLSEQEDEFDADTRWAVTWFEQNGHKDGRFGDAEVLSKAKNTGVNALRTAGIVIDGAGKVRLKRREELDKDWDPSSDKRLTVWEVTQHLIRALDEGGEAAAADLVRRVGGLADTARDLAYRLYSVCERKKWADEALGYNALVTAWPEITRLAASAPGAEQPQQTQLFS